MSKKIYSMPMVSMTELKAETFLAMSVFREEDAEAVWTERQNELNAWDSWNEDF